MKTYKVLIPLDGSALSWQIVGHVQRLFSPENCELIILRVTEPAVGLVANPPRPVSGAWSTPFYDSHHDVQLSRHPMYASQVWENVRAMAESELLPEIHALKDAGYAVSVLIQSGDPARTIVDVAERQAVDVVAMATHGRTGLRRLVLGSVAEAVLRELTVPLVLVRPFKPGLDSQTAKVDAAGARTGY
ncbi:MAG TPA: universal stress protein [Roseiflexaceae bacterium]|nr:universal stress protein [Roseiflexaceae bacterium]